MTYWIANMRHTNNGGYFFWALFTVFGIREAGSAFTQMVATAFASPEVASAFQSTAFTVFFLFAGFLIPEPLISNGWIWSAHTRSHSALPNERSTLPCTPASVLTCAPLVHGVPYVRWQDVLFIIHSLPARLPARQRAQQRHIRLQRLLQHRAVPCARR